VVDIYKMFAQLILTIGKAKTFSKNIPPVYLGVFDTQKIAFIEYTKIAHLFQQNDFNWNVTSSDVNTKEFTQIKQLITNILDEFKQIFIFKDDEKLLKAFISNNIAKANTNKIEIDESNFMQIYLLWLNEIKPLIDVDFDALKAEFNILDNDFFLADLFVDDKNDEDLTNHTISKENLFVTFSVAKSQGKLEGKYKIEKTNLVKGLFGDIHSDRYYSITNIKKYQNFWYRFKRPPIEKLDKNGKPENSIINRRDLLVPQDICERKGAFFTPQKWIYKSQEYIAKVLGKNWQDEYNVWDCAAGTGNLLVGLTNKRNIWASTLDQADINVMHDRIENGANLYRGHVFQFDFLNDEFFDGYAFVNPKDADKLFNAGKIKLTQFRFADGTKQLLLDDGTCRIIKNSDNSKLANLIIDLEGKEQIFALELKEQSKLPNKLQQILKDKTKRQKLLIYINPPYAEGDNIHGTGRRGVHDSKMHDKYKKIMGKASSELFAQFLIRIYQEITGCRLANFLTFKNLQAPNFIKFRTVFKAKLDSLFLVPANTFYNVSGQFQIGFFIWNLDKTVEFEQINTDVFDADGVQQNNKLIVSYDDSKYISDWLVYDYKRLNKLFENYIKPANPIGQLSSAANNFQKQDFVFIYTDVINKVFAGGRHTLIYANNLILISIYFAVRHAIEATWLNHYDQFLYPKNSWETNTAFHNDCLIFTLFAGKNRITCNKGVNHWIPFSEDQIGITEEPFASNFMYEFLAGKNPQMAGETNNETGNNKNLNEQVGSNELFTKEIPIWSLPQHRDFSCESENISIEAKNVFEAGLNLWRFYHQNPIKNEQTGIEYNVNASLYDIREYFQGRNEKGKMNNKSANLDYSQLINNLRSALKILADNRITPKVYEHEFLKD